MTSYCSAISIAIESYIVVRKFLLDEFQGVRDIQRHGVFLQFGHGGHVVQGHLAGKPEEAEQRAEDSGTEV